VVTVVGRGHCGGRCHGGVRDHGGGGHGHFVGGHCGGSWSWC